MNTPEGYTYKSRKAGDAVVIFHHGRIAGSLKGEPAREFLAAVGTPPSQQLMAEVSGDVRDGSEPGPPLRLGRDQEHRGPLGR